MNWFLFIIMAAIFLGFHDIAQKKALYKEYALALLSASSLIVMVMSLPILFFGKIQIVGLSMLFLIFIKSLFAVLFFFLTTKALRKMDISEFAPLLNLSPLFLLVLSIIFLGEAIKVYQFLGILLIIVGAYILELKDGLWSPVKRIKNSRHIHMIILGMIFGSIAALLDRYILIQSINVETFYLYQRIIIAVLLFLGSAIFYDGYKDIIIVCRRSFMWVFVASIFYLVGDYLYFMAVAVPVAMISLVIPVKRTSTLVSTLLGGEFFQEKSLFRKSLACLIMLSGIFLIVQ